MKTLNLDLKGPQNLSGNIKAISFCKDHILLFIIECYVRKFSAQNVTTSITFIE